MLQRLEAGHYDGKYDVINVRGSCAPNIFTKVAAFADRNTSAIIRFTNEYDIYIELDTVNKKVTAEFVSGNNPLALLPTNYHWYEIHYGGLAINTAADVDTITTWTAAYKVTVSYYCSIRNKEFRARQRMLRDELKHVEFNYPAVLY